MAGKKIWLTWLPGKDCEEDLAATMQALQMVGLEVSGAPWIDDLEKTVWTELCDMLSGDEAPDLWLVAGRQEDYANERFRYGLSLLSVSLLDMNPSLVTFAQGLDGEVDNLPTLLQHWTPLDSNPGWNAKIVAAAYSPPKTSPKFDFHQTVIAHSAIGQWFEVGPASGAEPWVGAMFGIVEGDAEIVFQAVGSRGQLPKTATNEYPSQGIKAEIAGDDYIAWALQNTVSPEQSYYVKVTGFPKKIFYSGHPGTDQAEVQVLELS
jgi:hypothetical protein